MCDNCTCKRSDELVEIDPTPMIGTGGGQEIGPSRASNIVFGVFAVVLIGLPILAMLGVFG